MSRIISAGLAHKKNNVISATMAKFLINHNSRFQMSHIVYHVPTYELKQLIENKPIMLKVSQSKVFSKEEAPRIFHYIEGKGIHYLFRPDKLKDVPILDFISLYEVRNLTNRDSEDENIMLFKDGHPAKKYQYIRERNEDIIPGINNWEFIDTSRFGYDILDPTIETNYDLEDYSKTVLVLCHPFRQKEDLTIEGSYLKKLRTVFKRIQDKYGNVLQNIQDIRNAVKI